MKSSTFGIMIFNKEDVAEILEKIVLPKNVLVGLNSLVVICRNKNLNFPFVIFVLV